MAYVACQTGMRLIGKKPLIMWEEFTGRTLPARQTFKCKQGLNAYLSQRVF